MQVDALHATRITQSKIKGTDPLILIIYYYNYKILIAYIEIIYK
jgi:hypothetical protein